MQLELTLTPASGLAAGVQRAHAIAKTSELLPIGGFRVDNLGVQTGVDRCAVVYRHPLPVRKCGLAMHVQKQLSAH